MNLSTNHSAPVTESHRRLVWFMSEALKTYGTPTEAEQMLADFVAKQTATILLQKSEADGKVMADLMECLDYAESEWKAQARLVKEACEREAVIRAEHDAAVAQVAVLREALQYYAEEAHWSDETTATEGGDEDIKIVTANACIFFDNGDCWRKAQDALADSPTNASVELDARKSVSETPLQAADRIAEAQEKAQP